MSTSALPQTGGGGVVPPMEEGRVELHLASRGYNLGLASRSSGPSDLSCYCPKDNAPCRFASCRGCTVLSSLKTSLGSKLSPIQRSESLNGAEGSETQKTEWNGDYKFFQLPSSRQIYVDSLSSTLSSGRSYLRHYETPTRSLFSPRVFGSSNAQRPDRDSRPPPAIF